jgi:hypothetical protein
MKWVGHAASAEEMRSTYNIVVGISEGKNHLEDFCAGGRIILE